MKKVLDREVGKLRLVHFIYAIVLGVVEGLSLFVFNPLQFWTTRSIVAAIVLLLLANIVIVRGEVKYHIVPWAGIGLVIIIAILSVMNMLYAPPLFWVVSISSAVVALTFFTVGYGDGFVGGALTYFMPVSAIGGAITIVVARHVFREGEPLPVSMIISISCLVSAIIGGLV
jgi:hypothetical protein